MGSETCSPVICSVFLDRFLLCLQLHICKMGTTAVQSQEQGLLILTVNTH